MKGILIMLLVCSALYGQTATITITSKTDPSKSVTLTGTLQVITLSATPSTFTYAPGGTQKITITTNDPAGVTCTATSGTLSSDCTLFTAPSAAAFVLIPAAPTLVANQTQIFATSPSTVAVWSINPVIGTLTAAGATATYIAPGTILAQQTVILTATSSAGSATATITLAPSGTAIHGTMSAAQMAALAILPQCPDPGVYAVVDCTSDCHEICNNSCVSIAHCVSAAALMSNPANCPPQCYSTRP